MVWRKQREVASPRIRRGLITPSAWRPGSGGQFSGIRRRIASGRGRARASPGAMVEKSTPLLTAEAKQEEKDVLRLCAHMSGRPCSCGLALGRLCMIRNAIGLRELEEQGELSWHTRTRDARSRFVSTLGCT